MVGGERHTESAGDASGRAVRDYHKSDRGSDTDIRSSAGTARIYSGMAESEVLGMSKIYNDLDEELLFTRNAELRLEIDIIRKELNKMAITIEEATTQVTAMQGTFDTFKTSVETSVTNLQSQVTTLEAQIAAGGTPDLTALSAALDAFQTDLNNSPPPVV